MSVVEALAREVGAVGKALHRLSPQQWQAPTRCPPMSVLQLTAHMARGAQLIEEALGAEPIDEPPERDSVTWWQTDLVAEAPAILQRALDNAERIGGPAEMVREWDQRWSAALRGARRRLDRDPVVPMRMGTITLSEFLKTRCVEVVVHHMDLDDAVGRAEHPDPEALEIVGDVLRGLLGTDLRPAGVDDVRFALIGTGRAPLDERERSLLGPLADSFPLLS